MTPKLLLLSLLVLALCPMLASADEPAPPTTSPIAAKPSTDVTNLVPVSSADISFPSDTLLIRTNGGNAGYVVSKNEFYLKDKLTGETNIESLADEFATAEEMRQFVSEEDGVWGQECMLVLYKAGEEQTAENRHLLTHKIEITLDKEVASMELLQQLAAAVGVEVGSERIGESGSAWLRATCGGSAFKASEILRSHDAVIKARPILTSSAVQMVTLPNDQYFNATDQYYIHPADPQHINVVNVWCGVDLGQRYFGRRVSISILDDGVEGEHPELDRNYEFGRDTDFVDGDNDGRPGDDSSDHGTAMAGLIGGRQNNGIGITGVAPAASLFSTRVFGVDSDPELLSRAIEHEKSVVDVIVVGFVSGGNYVDIGDLIEDSYFTMAERKDVPICYPAGTGGGNSRSDYDRKVAHRHTIATAGEDTNSELGSCLIATAPGAVMTTLDLTGDAGSEPGNYQFNFGGTSAANALTAGVVALMKEARPDLGWRDYQEILLLSGVIIDPTFQLNGAQKFGLPFKHSYLWGGGRLDAHLAVQLAEVWARLPDSAAGYRVVDKSLSNTKKDIGVKTRDDFDLYFGDSDNDGEIDRFLQPRTFLFDFNDTVSSKLNLRIEHIEVRIEWEEAGANGRAFLTPAYVALVSPYYTNGPGNASIDNIDDRGYMSAFSNNTLAINTPVEWTYTTVRHWGQVSTGGFDRIGVPDWENQAGVKEEDTIEAGVWELDIAIAPLVFNDDPDDPDNRLTRRLVDAEVIIYGTENNDPPTVISADISSSGNPGVTQPRTAYADEDLLINNVELFDREGDPIAIGYRWQMLGEDGLTWENLNDTQFAASNCEFDQQIRIEAKADIGTNTWGRYFFLYEPDGTEVGYYFRSAFSSDVPVGVTRADRVVPINGVLPNEGAAGIGTDIINALTGDGFTAVPGVDDGVVIVNFPPRTGNIPAPDSGTSNFKMGVEVNPGTSLFGEVPPAGNCFGSTSARLDSSVTIAGNKYRVILTPRQGLQEGFIFTSEEIIVNSRPITEAVHNVPYFYDADLWILTVPPEDLAPFLFINEISQGTGDTTTNREWVEIMVNFTTDLRGSKISNDIAGFDITFTNDPIWEEVEYGTLITIYNDGQRDPIIPADTPIADFGVTKNWILPSSSPLLALPSNGDGWGEFSNRDCTPANSGCDGAHAGLLTKFSTRDPIHGVSFNGNMTYVDIGLLPSLTAAYFNGTVLEPGDPDSPTDAAAWVVQGADVTAGPDGIFGTLDDVGPTPGAANSPNNQAVLDIIIAEAKTSIPTYRFYPGDGSQMIIDPVNGAVSDVPDPVASDIVPGLTIDRKTGVIRGTPNVPAGGVFTVKVQRWHSFSSEIQIFELNVEEAPPLVDTDDEDNDGLINLLEEALGTDPFAAQANILPVGAVVTSGGMTYQSISFRRLKGGVLDGASQEYTIGDLVYSIEASTDLQTWLTAPDVQIIQEAVVDTTDSPATVEVATFRILDAFGSAMLPERYFLRLRVTRAP